MLTKILTTISLYTVADSLGRVVLEETTHIAHLAMVTTLALLGPLSRAYRNIIGLTCHQRIFNHTIDFPSIMATPCWPTTWSTQLLLLSLLLLPFFTRLASTLYLRFRNLETDKKHTIPLVPYWLPGLFHLFSFLWHTADFPLKVTKQYGWERPLLIKAAHIRLTIVVNPKHIVTIFRSRFLSSRSITERSARYLLDIPADLMPFYRADDSGMAAEPRKESIVAPHNRILYMQSHTAQKWLASPHLGPIAHHFMKTLHRSFEALEIGEDWVDYPDLFNFLQITIRANIETLMGSKILELNPNLVDDFCAAKACAPSFFRGWPRWLIPQAFRSRDRVIDAIEKWHKYALSHGDHTNTGDSEPAWDPIWGTQYSKVRQQYMLDMKPLSARVRACEDWGFMFGLNANTHSAIFWYLLEPLKDSDLLARMMADVAACGQNGAIDIQGLDKQPLLQSVFSEVLRLRVSIMVSRVVEWADVKFLGYTIPQGDFVLMPTDSMHFNEEAWARAGRPPKKPLQDFDADRFLIPSDSGPEYSLDGLAGLWIPFGGGDRMCPGRHLAKLETLYTFAYLFSNYELQANGGDMKQVQADKKFAPFSALPPDRAVPFRIRRRTHT